MRKLIALLCLPILLQSMPAASQPSKPSTCFSDTFSDSTAFAQNWVTASVGSTAFTPVISGGRLQLTNNNGYISTAATLQRLFPTSNLIYVEFNYYSYPSGSGADGVAVTLSDSSVTPQPGGFGGSLGYAQRSDSGGINGFAGGWMGVALDEYGNYSNPTEGRNGGSGFRVDSVAVRGSGSGQTGYAYVTGTAAGLSPGVDAATADVNTPGPGHRYRIVIDASGPGQTHVTVDRDTSGAGTAYANLIPTFNLAAASGQAAIPANLMLSFTGSTGGSKNIHEIGNLSVCASNIQPVIQVDHFEIQHDGQGITCAPENVTIRACADAACATLMSVPVAVTLNPANGWVGGNVQTINGSGVIQLRQTTAATIPISISNSTPGSKPFTINKCSGVNTNTCNLPFVGAGLEFDVPTVFANKPSGAVRLRAVKNSGDASNSCVALFQNTTQSINFWSSYTSPSTVSRPVELRAGSGSGAFASISGASPGTALPLNFDSNGETTFEARYQDAGQMALHALYTGSGAYAGVVLSGSDSFVSTPAGFCVRTNNGLSGIPGACPAADSSCQPFAMAGNPFTLNIAAAAWQLDGDTDFCTGNGNTPSYAQNSLTLKSKVVAPSNGSDGVVTTTPATFNIAAGTNASGGTIALTNGVIESEVGVFNILMNMPTNAYYGATVPSGANIPVGRFIPHHFVVSNSSLTNRKTSCVPVPIPAPAFTYLGERLDLDFTVTAQNTGNVKTNNYQGAFARLTGFGQLFSKTISVDPLSLVRTAFDSQVANPRLKLFDLINNPMAVTWTNGTGIFSAPVTVARGATPDGAYANTALGIAPVDADNVATTGFNLDTDVPVVTPVVFDHVQIGSATELRYGRLRLDSVTGPVDLPLPLPVTAEYWNGAAFVANPLDTNCTTIASTLGVLSNPRGALSLSDTALSGSGKIVNGRMNALQLSAPAGGHTGSIDLTLNISALSWLQFDWDGNAATVDTGPSATASFGLYRGSDRVIYWQETK